MSDLLFAEQDLPAAPAPEHKSAGVYRVLARKYRPASFADLIGQDALVRTLTNAIASNRVAHAFMLTGVRGVGKTTSARIMARALNCIGRDGQGAMTPDPCGACDNCLAIAQDRHVDVIEIDAASNTSVANIREVIDAARYAPVMGRFKIYIIDEVHMLSTSAFNALLKTLEEPPGHVKFIMATTEIRKVPITVLSRCQRFDLRRVEPTALAAHYQAICHKEGVAIDDEALALIARAADGSVRDGLSLLDQAIAQSNGSVHAGDVREMLGLADEQQITDMFIALLQGELPQLLALADNLVNCGLSPLQLIEDLLSHTHATTLALTMKQKELDATSQARRLAELTLEIDIPFLARLWQMLLKGAEEVASASQPRQALDMVLIRIAHLASGPGPGELLRILEQKVTNAIADGQLKQSPAKASESLSGSTAKIIQLRPQSQLAVQPTEEELSPPQQANSDIIAVPADFRQLVALFAEQREGLLHGNLYHHAHLIKYIPHELELRLAPAAPRDMLGKMQQLLEKWTGKRWVISHSQQPGEASLAEQDRASRDSARAAFLAHPLIAEAMQYFPGAELRNFTAGISQQTTEDD